MDWLEKLLVEAVERLAAPADEQLAYLQNLGTYPLLDELALEFDDAFGPSRSASPASPWAGELKRLDAKLSAMSGPDNAPLWTPQALHGPEWE